MSNLEDLFQLLERCKQLHSLQLGVHFVNMDREIYGRIFSDIYLFLGQCV